MSNRESTEQGRSGRRGSEAEQQAGSGRQPRQGSDRVEAAGDPEPKHQFAPGHAPSEQGQTENPGPERIARNQAGFAGSGSGRGGSGGVAERSEEEAQSGAPREDHTRGGRQSVPGNRDPAE